jgi:hypothetical protein
VEFHTSARTNLATGMTYSNEQMNENLTSVAVDQAEVMACVQALQQLQQTS